MPTLNTAEIKEKTGSEHKNLQLDWKDSPSVKHLLDVISNIIALEYIQIAKQNPGTFLSDGALK